MLRSSLLSISCVSGLAESYSYFADPSCRKMYCQIILHRARVVYRKTTLRSILWHDCRIFWLENEEEKQNAQDDIGKRENANSLPRFASHIRLTATISCKLV